MLRMPLSVRIAIQEARPNGVRYVFGWNMKELRMIEGGGRSPPD
jgi:hypothetical protein